MPDNDNNYAARKASEADNERSSRISHEENADNVSKTSEQNDYQPNDSINSSTNYNYSNPEGALEGIGFISFMGASVGATVGSIIPGVGTLLGGIIGGIAAPLVIGALILVTYGVSALIDKISSFFFSKTDSTQEDVNTDNSQQDIQVNQAEEQVTVEAEAFDVTDNNTHTLSITPGLENHRSSIDSTTAVGRESTLQDIDVDASNSKGAPKNN